MSSKPALDRTRTLPTGTVVGSYSNYLDAQKAVDYLADQQFEVNSVSIVGNDLHSVERVVARLSYPRVALSGAFQGVLMGLFVGIILSIFGNSSNYLTIVPTIAIGAALFMLIAVVQYSLARGKRDFTSVSTIVARTYDVVVEPQLAARATQLLAQLPMGGNPAGAGVPRQPGGAGGADGSHEGAGQPGPGQDSGPLAVKPVPGQGTGQSADGGNAHGSGYGSPERPNDAAGQPGAGQPGAEQPSPESRPAASQHYPDLPDGRPMFGLRKQPAADTDAAEKPAEDERSDRSE